MRKPEGPRQTTRQKDRDEYRVLAKIIKRLRKKAKISQRGLCELIEKHSSFVSNIENGHVHPDLVSIVDICKVLGVNPGDVINEMVEKSATEKGKKQ